MSDWKARTIIGIVAVAGFWAGRWITHVDNKIEQVNQQEVRITLLEEMARQQLETQKQFSKAIDDFRKVLGEKKR